MTKQEKGGICSMAKKQAVQKVRSYKGMVIAYDSEGDRYQVFTADEWSYGEGYRTAEFDDCGTIQHAREEIDSY